MDQDNDEHQQKPLDLSFKKPSILKHLLLHVTEQEIACIIFLALPQVQKLGNIGHFAQVHAATITVTTGENLTVKANITNTQTTRSYSARPAFMEPLPLQLQPPGFILHYNLEATYPRKQPFNASITYLLLHYPEKPPQIEFLQTQLLN
jgi:hypothetical protein